LIKEVNREAVGSAREFEKALKKIKSGDVVALLVRRGAGTLFIGIKIPG
jgi:hypothetical protein